VRRFVDQHFLLVVVDRGDTDRAGDDHVAVFGGIADLENPLQRRKFLDIHLHREHLSFIVVKQLKKRDVPQFIGIAWHG
jgi:hypothetical protein